MGDHLFPERIETDRLRLERASREYVDAFELYELTQSPGWHEEVTAHMPWYRFDTVEACASYLDGRDQKWRERETAGYVVRPREGEDDAGELVGLTNYGPEWDERRAGSGILLAKRVWGRGYGLERASAFVELTFERFDLEAYYTTCAAGNEPSRRMIEKYVERFGGRHEGLLRQHSPRPSGEVTDQHRFTILREEYEASAASDRSWATIP